MQPFVWWVWGGEGGKGVVGEGRTPLLSLRVLKFRAETEFQTLPQNLKLLQLIAVFVRRNEDPRHVM